MNGSPSACYNEIMKRIIRINFQDGSHKDLELSNATSVRTKNEMLYLDKLPDESWRMIWNESLIPDFSTISNLEIIRED
jgi:hypothetical protein